MDKERLFEERYRRLYIFRTKKALRNCHFIDIAVPGDKRIELKE